MIEKIKKGTPGFRKKYDGWYIATDEDKVKQWELGISQPIDAYDKLKYKPALDDPGYDRDLWVWKKETENEFGPISP